MNRQKNETVILVHGLWMHGFVFLLFRRWLARRGYDVRWFSYPSVRHGLQQNADALARFVAGIDSPIIHLVGHSLGGLVILTMLAQRNDPRVRRVVLMGSPCGGSHVAAKLAQKRLAPILGCALQDWLAQPCLPPLPGAVEIGVLAGSRSFGLGRLFRELPAPNDGTVTLAETRLAVAADFITLKVSHTEMMVSRACTDQVAAFLETGRFKHDQT